MSCSSLTGSCRRSLSACWSFPASCRLCSSCMLLGFTRAPAVSPAADQCKHMDPSCRSLRQLFLVDLSPLDSGGISHVDAQGAAVNYSDPMFNIIIYPRPAAGSILFLPPAICLGAQHVSQGFQSPSLHTICIALSYHGSARRETSIHVVHSLPIKLLICLNARCQCWSGIGRIANSHTSVLIDG